MNPVINALYEKKDAEGFKTWKDLAKAMGVTPAYMSDLINGRRDPGPRILRQLSFRKVVQYEVEDGRS
jgi:transcriptional regulator with XRE-family HTH domain